MNATLKRLVGVLMLIVGSSMLAYSWSEFNKSSGSAAELSADQDIKANPNLNPISSSEALQPSLSTQAQADLALNEQQNFDQQQKQQRNSVFQEQINKAQAYALNGSLPEEAPMIDITLESEGASQTYDLLTAGQAQAGAGADQATASLIDAELQTPSSLSASEQLSSKQQKLTNLEDTPSTKPSAAALNQALKSARALGNSAGTAQYGVQVALSPTQSQANALAKKLKAQGYPVTLSATNRGTRVLVGPEPNKQAALALKEVLNADANLGVSGAWVMRSPRGVYGESAGSNNKPKSTADQKPKASTAANQLKPPKADQAQAKQVNKPAANQTPSQPSGSAAQAETRNYTVQVALASNTQRAKDLSARLSLAGFKAQSSPEGPGVKVTVGAGLTKEEALAVKRKIDSNAELGIEGAWVRVQ